MLYVIKAMPNDARTLVASADSWEMALSMAHPESVPQAPRGRIEVERYLIDLSTMQSLAMIIEGNSEAKQFCDAFSMMHEPWCSIASGVAALAVEAKVIHDPVLWCPKFYDTEYGISYADQRRRRAS